MGVANGVIYIYVGVADQLQTNYASDLRHMLKSVFDGYTSDVAARLDVTDDDTADDQLTPTDGFTTHLTSQTITSDETSPNHNHNYRASSLLGIFIIILFYFIFLNI